MHPQNQVVAVAVIVTMVAAPLLLAAVGAVRAWSRPGRTNHPEAAGHQPSTTALIINSSIAYTLAFNLVFLIQELFLVVPKALTPGLEPILFHNNHTWSGTNPVANLLQGTGFLAVLATGLIAWVVARRSRAGVVGIFQVWLAYHGLLQGLLQVVGGVLAPSSDLGLAMDYLRWSPVTKTVAALGALAAIAASSLSLVKPMLGACATQDEAATPASRTRMVFVAGALPALAGVVLIAPFRVPGDAATVAGPPLVVGLAGIPWMLAGAWAVTVSTGSQTTRRRIVWEPLAALLGLLVFFHLVLARGVRM